MEAAKDDRYLIAVLAEDAQRKKERYQVLGMMNSPQDPEARIKARIEREQARRDWMLAEAELELAMHTSPYQVQLPNN